MEMVHCLELETKPMPDQPTEPPNERRGQQEQWQSASDRSSSEARKPPLRGQSFSKKISNQREIFSQ